MKELDPVLGLILGVDELTDDGLAISGETDDELDPVAAFRFREQYKINPPNTKTAAAPQSISEIATSLDNVRRAISGENPYAARLRKLNFPLAKMAASAADFSGEDSPVTKFLVAASKGSDQEMKAAIKAMVLLNDPVQ